MHRHGPPPVLTWRVLAAAEPGVVGGLILEFAEAARRKSYANSWDRDLAIYWSIEEGQRAALNGRRPAVESTRLASWLVRILKARLHDHETYWLGHDFVVARTLELAGLVELEVDDDYVLSMLTDLVAIWDWDRQRGGDPIAWFTDDPGLIDRAYWRAYEIEGHGSVSFRANNRGPNWLGATIEMIDRGMVSRVQVIDACLGSLQRDFASAAARWFVDLAVALNLTVDELSVRQPSVRRLLVQQVQVTRNLALTWLRELDNAGLLDGMSTGPALDQATAGGTKASALAAARLLESIRRRTPSADVVTAGLAGLGHPHADVQRASAKLLLAAGAHDALWAESEILDPSVRRDLGIPIEAEPAAPQPTQPSTPISVPARSSASGDLGERVARLLENPDDAYELELVLDELSQGKAGDQLRPLLKRARTVLGDTESGWNMTPSLKRHIADLVITSVERAPTRPPEPMAAGSRFLYGRLTEVRRVLRGEAPPEPLLATPTSPEGWLDPDEFVARLGAVSTWRRHDLIAALLRLAPGDRGEALRALEAIRNNRATQSDLAVGYALGEDPTSGGLVTDRPLWIAASRSRYPQTDDQFIIGAGVEGAGRSRELRATIGFGSQVEPVTGFLNRAYQITFADAVTVKQAAELEQPTSATTYRLNYQGHAEAWKSWHALTWPHDAEHFAITAFEAAFWQTTWTTTYADHVASLGALRRHPGRLGPLALTTLALSLDAATTEARVHAVDAVIDMVGRGRITADDLAGGIATTHPVAVPTRLADSLRRVAEAGRADITVRALTLVLPTIPTTTRGLHALLDLLHQEQLRTALPVVDEALRAYLSGFSSSSKAARSARGLLSL